MSNEITQADRELLAREYERNGLLAFAKAIRANRLIRRDAVALRAIAAARRQAEPATVMGEFSLEDWSELAKLPKGTRIYTLPPLTAPPSAPVGVEGLVAMAIAQGKRLQWPAVMDTLEQLQALAQQPAAVDAAKHWHDLYRRECQLRQDDAARYGQQIADLEAAAQQEGAP